MFDSLHNKSDYSLGYGTASPEKLASHAARLGYKAVALTDLETLAGQVRFHECCRARNIRPITGIELRFGFDSRRNAGAKKGRIILLTRNGDGYRNLCRIVSERSAVARSRPDPLPSVTRDPEGLFALSDDTRAIERLLSSGGYDRDRVGFLLVRPGNRDVADDLKHAQRMGVRIVADQDAVFLSPEDYPLHRLQRAIRLQKEMASVPPDQVEEPQR